MEGLPSNIVNDILQTRNGFLWISTPNDLVRFDGRHFTSVRFAGITEIVLPRALAEAPDGALWIGTSHGLFRIPSAALDEFGPIAPQIYHTGSGESDAVVCLRFTRAGTLFVGTTGGLFRLDQGRFSLVLGQLGVSRIEEAADGHLLVITGAGFREWDGARLVEHTDLPSQLGVPKDKIYHVFDDHTGARWFCTAAGVARLAGGSIQKLQPYGFTRAPEAYRGYEDPQGNVWVMLATGLFRATAAGLEALAPKTQVKFVAADRDGDLWVGTNGTGIIRYKNRPVRMFTTADGLPNNTITTVMTASDGKLWVGSNCGGISWFDGHRFQTYSEKDGLMNSCVYVLEQDINKDLWIGTFAGGAFRFHDGRFTSYSKAQGLPSDIVKAIRASRDGSVWIATRAGVSRVQDGKIRNYLSADGIGNDVPVSLYEDRQGVMWMGTNHRIGSFRNDRFVPLAESPPDFYSVLGEVPSGAFYVSARYRGIYRVAGDKIVPLSTEPLIVCSMFQFGPELWFIGDGISRAPIDSLKRWEQEPDTHRDLTQYDTADGISLMQFSDSAHDLARTPDGKLWAATLDGLAMIDLPRLPRDGAKVVIYIEPITVGRIVVPPGHGLELAPGSHHVELHFDAIELRSPEKIRFQYRMDGVDQEWLDAGTNGSAIYTSFALGTHRFHVRACNRDGIWDRAGITYDITQLPFFYETTLFRLGVVAIGLLMVTAAYQFRLRQIAVETNVRLDERVTERTRLARDLHDTLLQTIHASAMMVNLVQEEADNPAPTQRGLEKLSAWLARALQEARASLDSLRSSTIETNDLAAALSAAGEQYLAGSAMRFAVSVEGTAKEMHPIVRDEIYHIGCEAIRNACKHSQGTKVEVKLQYARDLVLRVRDDGVGVDREVASKGKAGHFGLIGMRERATRIGGRFAVHSLDGRGTEIEVVVPRYHAFRGTVIS